MWVLSLPVSFTDWPSAELAAASAAELRQKLAAAERRPIVGGSLAMRRTLDIVAQAAPSQATVLLLGESGTGKELIARAMHEKSNRKMKPFVAINCGALRETLLESELFGHEKGSFTGAYTRKIGLAEAASGGTLFLDEIGELTPGIQAKLLRFLQEGEIYRVGGKEAIKVDIRIISATNRDLEAEVNKGGFREDLYYRINTIVISSPPLRRRKEDIAPLVKHFLSQSTHAYLNRGRAISDDAMKSLLSYEWPGNIRELENCIKRATIMADGNQISADDIGLTSQDAAQLDNSLDLRTVRDEAEKRAVIAAMGRVNGNVVKAAELLGVSRPTLYDLMHRLGLK